jgi:hypothetical protein
MNVRDMETPGHNRNLQEATGGHRPSLDSDRMKLDNHEVPRTPVKHGKADTFFAYDAGPVDVSPHPASGCFTHAPNLRKRFDELPAHRHGCEPDASGLNRHTKVGSTTQWSSS